MPPKNIVGKRPVYTLQQPSFCTDHQNCVMHNVEGSSGRRQAEWSSDIRLLALDMDGTLLDTNSKVLPSSIKAIKVWLHVLLPGLPSKRVAALLHLLGIASDLTVNFHC